MTHINARILACLINYKRRLGEELDMARDCPFLVQIKNMPGKPFGQTMNEVRIWLDHHQIESLLFMPVAQADHGIGYKIGFDSEDEAYRFEREFRSA